MSYTSTASARDDILGLLTTVVNASSITNSSAGSNQLVLIFDGVVEQPPKPQPPSPWARVNLRHLTDSQTSLAGENGLRRYTPKGIILVELYTDPLGLVSNDAVLDVVKSAYRGQQGPLGQAWFRNVRAVEIGQDGEWWHTNVFADFEYDLFA